jgi:hypothetical protein
MAHRPLRLFEPRRAQALDRRNARCKV